MSNKFTAVYKKTKSWFVGWVEEVPGVNTQGKTLKETRENLREALLLVIEANKESSRSNIDKRSITKREFINIKIPA